jgi:lysophospholipase L1-like esterase
MIDKIYAYGDSFTAGDGVSNNEAWPAKLSELLTVPEVNRGVPGGSNKLSIINLLDDFIKIKSPEKTFVVFSWTGISRTAVYFEEKERWENILLGHEPYDPFLKKKKEEWYAYVYDDFEGLMDYYSQQIFVSSFLTARNVPFVFVNSFLEHYLVREKFDKKYSNIVKLLPADKYVLGYDNSIYQSYCVDKKMTCSDGYHPSAEAHRELAIEIKTFAEKLKII